MRKQKHNTVHLGLAGKTRITKLVVTCDMCKTVSLTTRATATLMDEATKRGWLCKKKGPDLCPSCRPAPKPERAVVSQPIQGELFQGE